MANRVNKKHLQMITNNSHDDLLLKNDFMSFTSEREMFEKKSNLLNKLLHFVGKKLKRLSNKRCNSFWTKINVSADFDDMCLSRGLLTKKQSFHK